MLIKDPAHRISAKECLNHPWTNSYKKSKVPIIDNDLLYNIVNFVQKTNFMKILSMQLSAKLDSKYHSEIIEHFRAFDHNNDGLITFQEFVDSIFCF